MLLTIIVLSVLLTIAICLLVACYIALNINLEKIQTYENWIVEFNKDVQDTYVKLKEVDSMNMFSRDDDVGFAFTRMIDIIEKLKDKIK